MRSALRSHRMTRTGIILLMTTFLCSCSWFEGDDKKTPLPGDRISVLELQKSFEPTDTAATAEGFVSPEPWSNDFWPQAGGYPNHSMQSLALNPNPLTKLWSSSIGEGSTDEFPITAQPVVFDGLIFTLDTESNVRAFSVKSGERIWSNTVRAKKEDEQVIGGGLAVSNNILFVTNGYNELLALNPKKGGIYWRASLSSPSRAAPTIFNDTVYVMTVDNRVEALNAATGQKKWSYEGLAEETGLVGAASPAVDNELVIAPLSSGELTALRTVNGSLAWSDNLSPMVRMGGSSSLPDIRALPIIDKNYVFAISYGGRIVAIESRTGRRIWQRDIGGAKSPWVAGNTIFFISANAELVALSHDTGGLLWVKNLSSLVEDEARRNSLLWQGPVLAGGRLIVSSPDGSILEISPEKGNVLRRLKTSSGLATAPIVAGSTLFLLHQDGELEAWH